MSVESTQIKSSLRGLPLLIYIRAWKLSSTPLVQSHVFFQGVLEGPQGKRLQLRIPDSTWRQEMIYQKEHILKRYNDLCLSMGLNRHEVPVECHIVAF